MPFSIVTSGTVIARNAGALYNFKAGNATMNWGLSQYNLGGDALLNTVYNNSVGSAATTDVASTLIANLGVTGTGVAALQAYFVGVLNAAPVTARGAAVNSLLTQFASLATSTDPIAAPYQAAAIAWNTSVTAAVAYAGLATNTDTTFITAPSTATSFTLTTGVDNITGSSGNDTFNATGVETLLGTGDTLNGGAGTDTLNADVYGPKILTPNLNSIENVNIRSQGLSTDAGTANNIGPALSVIDAQRSAGVTKWASVDSRADVVIEDVRILDSQITKDITIEFKQSDPGNVDFGVYFNELSLRNSGNATSQLSLQVMDTVAAAAGLAPLLNSTYGSFTLTATVAGVSNVITISSQAIQDAQTYVQMVAAFQAALDAQFGAGTVVASLGANFTVNDPASGIAVTGQSVLITAQGAVVLTTPAGSGWSSTGVAPPASNFYTNFTTGGTSATALVTSTIILDDVGMADTGGDLVVGGMSTGATSNDQGVQRFEITVNDNSKLQTINSTNDSLREVVIVNGTTSSVSNAYLTTVKDAGNLTVNGNAAFNAGIGFNNAADAFLPGLDALHAGAFGFTDVRLIDGSAMTGKLAFTAQVTSNSIAKYINLVDTAASPTADVANVGTNTNHTVLGANFIYLGGTNNDTMKVTLDAAAVASRSTVVSGQSDFTFLVDGGAGNDAITVNVNTSTALNGVLQNWYNNQDLNNNVTINGGAGNDTIRKPGAGDSTIDAGAGDDAVYADNTGAQTGLLPGTGTSVTALGTGTTSNGIWVFNTYDQVNAVANGAARNIYDIRGDVDNTYNLYKATVSVSFKTIPSATITLANSTTYKTTDSEINQAIKNAINTDATLSKLLLAQDGPGNSLIVTSLIDGVMSPADLVVTVAAPTTELSAAEIASVNTAWGTAIVLGGSIAAMTATLATFTANQDYVTAMAQDSAGVNIVGAASTATSDNFITPGPGNDVIVLGTTVSLSDVGRSSNDVVTFGSGFGNDVILNFNNGTGVTGFGVDHLNLYAFLGTAAVSMTGTAGGAFGPTLGDSQVHLAAEVTAAGATQNNSLALVTALVKASAVDAGVTTASKQVVIIVNAQNVGAVYSIVNGTAAADSVVSLEGTIDLADTGWGTLSVANFQVPVASTSVPVGARTIASEGPNTELVGSGQTALVNNQVLVGTPNIDTLSAGGFTGVTMTGLASGDLFVVPTGSTNTVITDLVTGDDFTINTTGTLDAAMTVAGPFVASAATVNTSAAVGNATLTAVAAGSIINVALATGTMGFTLAGGAGNDTLTGSALADTLTSGATGTDILNGGGGNDTMSSGGGTVTFNGGTGVNTITTGAGVDTINTAAGGIDNVAAFGTGADVITVAAGGTANVTVAANWTAAATSTNAGTLNFIMGAGGLTFNAALLGGTVGIKITGSVAAADTLITGTVNADTFVGNAAWPTVFTGGAGADVVGLGINAAADTVNLAPASMAAVGTNTSADSITNFLAGQDILNISLTGQAGSVLSNGNGGAMAATAAGATTVQHIAAATATALGAATQIVVLDGVFANAAAMITGIGGGTTTLTEATSFAANNDLVVVWSDGTNGHVSLVNDANTAATAVMLAAELTATEIATLVGITTGVGLTTADFGLIA